MMCLSKTCWKEKIIRMSQLFNCRRTIWEVLKKSCSQKFCNIHRKTPVLETLLIQNVAKVFKTSVLKNICRQLLLEIIMKLRKLRLVDYFFDVVRNKFQRINIYTRVVKKRMKGSREEYVMWTCFTFWTMKIIFWNL